MRRRSLAGTAVAAVLACGLLAPQLVESAPRQDPRAEREKVQAEQAALAADLNTTKASKEEIDAALQALNDNLQTQEAALARTRDQIAQAKQDIADAEAAITRLEEEIVSLRDEIRRRAVQAYVSPPGDDVFAVLESNDFVSASNKQFYLELRSQDDADVNDRLNGAISEVDYQRERAEAARVLAEEKEAEQAERTEAVREAKAQKQELATKLEATINSQIARSIELQKTDRALAKQIAEQQAALVARLAAEKAATEEAARSAAQQAAQQAAQSQTPAPPSTQNPDGGENSPLPPIPGGGGGGTGTGGIALCTVGGITVNCAIQAQVGQLLNAARADGLALSGGGYRDPSQQIELRKRHCGTSYFAIYQMSPSSCRPPTARPGQSQHEIGLAIDFSNCSSRGTACYQWLAANAARFGFYNLPSEPWHWSTTGS